MSSSRSRADPREEYRQIAKDKSRPPERRDPKRTRVIKVSDSEDETYAHARPRKSDRNSDASFSPSGPSKKSASSASSSKVSTKRAGVSKAKYARASEESSEESGRSEEVRARKVARTPVSDIRPKGNELVHVVEADSRPNIAALLMTNPLPKYRGENARVIASMWKDISDLKKKMNHLHNKRNAIAIRRWLLYPNDSGAFYFLDDLFGVMSDGHISKRRAVQAFRHFFRSPQDYEYLRGVDLLTAFRRVDVNDSEFLIIDNDEHVQYFRECLMIMLQRIESNLSESEEEDEPLSVVETEVEEPAPEPVVRPQVDDDDEPAYFGDVTKEEHHSEGSSFFDSDASSEDSDSGAIFAGVKKDTAKVEDDGPLLEISSGSLSDSSSSSVFFKNVQQENDSDSEKYHYVEDDQGVRRKVKTPAKP